MVQVETNTAMNKLLRTLAIVALLLSVIATGVGGFQDVLSSGTITQRHAWHDGQYLVLLSIALILISA